jgi:hypothetical protein
MANMNSSFQNGSVEIASMKAGELIVLITVRFEQK